MKEPDFFLQCRYECFNIYDDALSVPKVGNVTLSQLLTNKSMINIHYAGS